MNNNLIHINNKVGDKMDKQYLEQIAAHVDNFGRLSHRNGVELLAEVVRLREALKPALAIVVGCIKATGDGDHDRLCHLFEVRNKILGAFTQEGRGAIDD